jgi:uncharacterized protein YkwD
MCRSSVFAHLIPLHTLRVSIFDPPQKQAHATLEGTVEESSVLVTKFAITTMFGLPFLKHNTCTGGKYLSFESSRYGRKRTRRESCKKWRTSGSWSTVERVMATLDQTDSTLEQSFSQFSSGELSGAMSAHKTSLSSSTSTVVPVRAAASSPCVCTDITCSHVLINHTRQRWNSRLSPLKRSRELDEIACQHAQAMAASRMIFHPNPTELFESLSARPMRRLGANVISGSNALDMHMNMLGLVANYTNMVDARYSEVGIATARAPGTSGKLYLCVLFRG